MKANGKLGGRRWMVRTSRRSQLVSRTVPPRTISLTDPLHARTLRPPRWTRCDETRVIVEPAQHMLSWRGLEVFRHVDVANPRHEGRTPGVKSAGRGWMEQAGRFPRRHVPHAVRILGIRIRNRREQRLGIRVSWRP